MSSADNLCKQFKPRPGPTEHRSCSGYKSFNTLIDKKDFFENDNFGKKVDSVVALWLEVLEVPGSIPARGEENFGV